MKIKRGNAPKPTVPPETPIAGDDHSPGTRYVSKSANRILVPVTSSGIIDLAKMNRDARKQLQDLLKSEGVQKQLGFGPPAATFDPSENICSSTPKRLRWNCCTPMRKKMTWDRRRQKCSIPMLLNFSPGTRHYSPGVSCLLASRNKNLPGRRRLPKRKRNVLTSTGRLRQLPTFFPRLLKPSNEAASQNCDGYMDCRHDCHTRRGNRAF
jgi:hypothetical protein